MASQADAIIAEINALVRRKRNELAIEVTANLTEPPDLGGTPIQTGNARNNWLPTVESPASSPIGDDKQPATQAEQQQGLAVVAGYQGDGPVYVTNNVPYIQRLNDGWSKQAPTGFVERAIDKALKDIK